MKTFRNILIGLALAMAAFLAFGFYLTSTPEGKARVADRQRIEACRESYRRAPSSTVDSMCLRLEAAYRTKWNRNP